MARSTLELSCSELSEAHDVVALVPADFRLASGERLPQTCLRGRLQGRPGGPVVAVAGGISSGRFVASKPDGSAGWWAQTVRTGGPVDLATVRVFSFDFAPYAEGLERPLTLTTHDQARLVSLLLDAAGVRRLKAFVGASYGGAVALAFAELFPERLERLVAISAAHRADPLATAWRGIQRRILAFAAEVGRPEAGVALARELAVTTYRTPEEFRARFAGPPASAAGDPYPACEYLIAQGARYPSVTTPARWTTLSDSLDRHAVEPERINVPATLVAFDSDRLVPLADVAELARRLPNLERAVVASSLYGHDGFLKEPSVIADALRTALSALNRPELEGLAA